jgi:hypothetical protein
VYTFGNGLHTPTQDEFTPNVHSFNYLTFIHFVCNLGFPPLYNFVYPHFYLQTEQLEEHLANGVMGGEEGRGAHQPPL